MNKIQVLIDNGFITDNDIQEYISSNQDFYANDEPEYPDYDEAYDQYINQLEYEEQLAHELNKDHSTPEYVIASTNEMVEETMVFPADEHGEITSFSDLACIALRYGYIDWRNADEAVSTLNTDEYTYEHVKCIIAPRSNIHNLYKKVYTNKN